MYAEFDSAIWKFHINSSLIIDVYRRNTNIVKSKSKLREVRVPIILFDSLQQNHNKYLQTLYVQAMICAYCT